VFAHNGTLPRIRRRRLRDETPLGETDSEHAFCWMIEELRAAFPGGYPRQPRRLWKVIAELGGMLGAEGKFNFLLADGQHLYARCGTKLSHIVRQAPFGRATLRDAELAIDFSAVAGATDRVAVVATEPLTRDEAWQQGTPGTLWVFNRGALAATLASRGARLDHEQGGTLKGSRAPRDGLAPAKLARAHAIVPAIRRRPRRRRAA
jgi:glutamine amidotransferase